MIVIVDYGMGNLRSILYKIEKLKGVVSISSNIEAIEQADKLILPGVGYFAKGMENIHSRKLYDVLNKRVCIDKIPVLGICLGAQLITRYSEEGNAEGFGWIDAETKKFSFDISDRALRIPHVGWNAIEIVRSSPLLHGIEPHNRFYFTHSYYIDCKQTDACVANTYYGLSFTSAIQKDNIFGTQFHPEKSHHAGRAILENFITRC